MKKRMFPVPSVNISMGSCTDEDDGRIWNYVTIDVMTGDYCSNGTITLDDLDDLFLLRNAIDKYISKNDLKPSDMTKKSKTQQPDPVCSDYTVIEGYLKGWAPAEKFERGVFLKTTQDIVDDLQDMVDIDTTVVAYAMTLLGFKAYFSHDDGPHGWMMREDPEVVHTICIAMPGDEE